MQELDTRRNKDKRTCRKENAKVFKKVVEEYMKKNPKLKSKKKVKKIKGKKNKKEKFEVFVRKRPIFQHEIKRSEYDIVSCYNKNQTKNGKSKIVIHDCRMRSDLKVQNAYVESFEYVGFHEIFSEKSTNKRVYSNTGKVMMNHVLNGDGNKGTILMFGQTGSGKTYTMTSICQQLIKDIFALKEDSLKVSISCFEIDVNGNWDLLNSRREVFLRCNENDKVIVSNLSMTECEDENDFIDLFQEALDNRKTHETYINSVSSRSHCFIEIVLTEEINGEEEFYGSFRIADFAGSEKNADQFFHKGDRIEESAFINTSLMGLKDCLRIYHHNIQPENAKKQQRIPFRSSKLSRLLKENFFEDQCKLMIIGTISPCPTDTEHSINTLNCLSNMSKSVKLVKEIMNIRDVLETGKKLIHPSKWNHKQVLKWGNSIKKGKYKRYTTKFPSSIDGKQICRFSTRRFTQTFGDEKIGKIWIV